MNERASERLNLSYPTCSSRFLLSFLHASLHSCILAFFQSVQVGSRRLLIHRHLISQNEVAMNPKEEGLTASIAAIMMIRARLPSKLPEAGYELSRGSSSCLGSFERRSLGFPGSSSTDRRTSSSLQDYVCSSSKVWPPSRASPVPSEQQKPLLSRQISSGSNVKFWFNAEPS